MRLKFLLSLLFSLASLPLVGSRELLFFYHIPKCGGTTVSSLLSQKYSSQETLDTYTQKAMANPNFDPSPFSYIRGHVAFRVGFPRCPSAKNITFLREPVERFLSLYRYYKAYHSNTPDIYTFYESRKNFQVRSLSSLPWNDPAFSLEDHLESAKENLRTHFFFVGITERMGESLKTLYQMMGWNPLTWTPVFNTTSRPPYPQKLIDYLNQQEWADWELYDYANTLFNVLHENTQSNPIKPQKVKMVTQVTLTFDQPFEGEGWGYRQLERKAVYRTSVSKDAYIDFPLARNRSYKLEFYARFPTRNCAKDFEVMVNGKKIKLVKTPRGRWTRFRATIPQSLLTKKITRLTFHVPDLLRQTDPGNKKTSSLKGISLSKVELK